MGAMNGRTEHVINSTVPDRIGASNESDARATAERIVCGLNNSSNARGSAGAHVAPWEHEAIIYMVQRVIMATRAGAQ